MVYEGIESPLIQTKPSKKVFDLLERSNFLAIRESDERFNAWFESLSYDDFEQYITRLNGILRKTPISERTIDGQHIYVSANSASNQIGYLPPDMRDKSMLLIDTFSAIKTMKDNNERALLTYYAIQYIHPFKDGNGRTGRLLYVLFSDERKDVSESKLAELLDHDEDDRSIHGRQLFARKILHPKKADNFITREVARDTFGETFLNRYGEIYYSDNFGSVTIPNYPEITPAQHDYVKRILSQEQEGSFPFRSVTVLTRLQETKQLDRFQIEGLGTITEYDGLPEDKGKEVFGIDSQLFEENLTVQDIQALILIHRKLKISYVKKLIDIFIHPEAYTITNNKGTKISLKSVFTR